MDDGMTKDDRGETGVTVADPDAVGAGRLGVYTALGAGAGTVPLPWLPDTLAKRIRGALAQDIAARHGVSLTTEARTLLSEPEPRDAARGVFGQAVKFATGKLLARFTPLGFLPP